jgi:soluble lytic murein transglycosylase-like protein
MTLPGNAPSIPLRAASTSGPGARPAGARPNAPKPVSQNAFAVALARAQLQNQLFQNGVTASANNSPGPGLPYAQQAGLSPDLQALTGQNGLPPQLQALATQNGLPPQLQALATQSGLPIAVQTPIQALMPSARPATTLQVPGGFGPIITQAAQKYGVDPALIAAVMETESKFNPNAVSGAGAKGLMQLMPATARGLGVTDPSDPTQSIMGGAKLLGVLTQKYGGNLELALAAYNAGSGAVDKAGGIPPYGETRKYVPLVLAAYERFKAQTGGAAPATPATPGAGR